MAHAAVHFFFVVICQIPLLNYGLAYIYLWESHNLISKGERVVLESCQSSEIEAPSALLC